jgi:outer membrane protein assembly factor BamB
MSFDNSANFSFADNSLNYWKKPINISAVTFIVNGGGGGGGSIGRGNGGGGAFIYATYNYLNPDISYNITINIGGGGKAPPVLTGGQSIGGYVDPSGIIQSNGGSGSTLAGVSSGGGGGMTSLFYTDSLGNKAIRICAGGGGGGGSVSGSNGGASGNIGVPLYSGTTYSSIGSNGTGTGYGQGGNSDLSGNAGLGGINGGVNGFNFIDGSNNQPNVNFIGGGGGNGGTFSGGGGGAGFGGAAGGKYGGGGGGGSICTNSNFNFFILGGGGAGGLSGQNGINGSVTIYWNDYQPIIPPVIVKEFMLDSQHTCKSIYTAPSTKPASVTTYNFPSSIIGVSNPYSGVIGTDAELYTITPNGNLYSFDHNFIHKWFFSVTSYNFFGTPVISTNNTLYVSARASSPTQSIGYFYAIIDNTTSGALKWPTPFILQDNYDNPSTSPVADASGHIIFGTQNGSIYAIIDETNQAIYGWKFPSVVVNVPVTGTPVFDASYTRLCYTTSDYINALSSIYVLDLSKNSVLNNIPPTLKWHNTLTSGEYYNTPSFGDGYIYVNTTAGNVYAYDISNNVGNTNYTRWAIINVNDVSLSNIAVNTNNRIYFTSQNALNVIDSSNGQLLWTYPIDSLGASVPDNSTPIIDASNNIIFGSRSNHLYSINDVQRTFNWRYGVGGAIEAMPIINSDGGIYVSANNAVLYDFSGTGIVTPPTQNAISSMYMLNVKHTGLSSYYGPNITPTPLIAWSADFVSGNLFVSPSIGISANGTLYIGSNDGYVYSYTDGQVSPNWHVQVNNTNKAPFTSPNSMYTTPLIGPDGTIYIGSNEGYLYALNPSNGAIKWSYSAGYPLQSSPIMDASGSIYFGAGNNVYAIGDAGYAGYNKWLIPFFPTNAHVNSSPALGQNGYLYFGSDDGFVYAVDRFFGTQKWSFDANNYNTPPMGIHPIYTSATVDASNNVIIGNGSYMNGTLFYLDGLTGALLWSKTSVDWGTNSNIGPFYNTVAVKGDTIYLSTIAYVYALNRLTGLKNWYYFNTNCYYTSPIIDVSGTLFFASIKAQDDPAQGWLKNDGILHSITDMGNSFISNWSIKVASLGRLAPPVLGSNNTIYITGTSNKVYAIR